MSELSKITRYKINNQQSNPSFPYITNKNLEYVRNNIIYNVLKVIKCLG